MNLGSLRRKKYEQVSSGHKLYAPLQTANDAHLRLSSGKERWKKQNQPLRERGVDFLTLLFS